MLDVDRGKRESDIVQALRKNLARRRREKVSPLLDGTFFNAGRLHGDPLPALGTSPGLAEG